MDDNMQYPETYSVGYQWLDGATEHRAFLGFTHHQEAWKVARALADSRYFTNVRMFRHRTNPVDLSQL